MKSELNIAGKHLQITRVFDAPRAEVFDWWAQAEKLQQWSGCKEATRCEVVMDFRVGGSFTQKMQIAVDGGMCEFSFIGTYEEIVVPERISYRADLGQGITRMIVEFFDLGDRNQGDRNQGDRNQGDRTRVVLTQDGFRDPGSRKIVSQGTLESLDKLDSILNGQAVLNRL
jgi:uncharacterized protein YndB with AHSA1/START domain